MQIRQILQKTPKKSLYYLLLCSTGILMFISIGLYPLQTSLNRLDEDIARIKARIEEQKALFPLYKELMGKFQKKDSKLLLNLPKTSLSVDQIDGITTIFKKIAQQCNLEAISITPDAKSLANNSKWMSVSLIVRGDFLKLRKFLFELEALPWLEHLQEVQIQEALAGKELRLKTLVAITNEKSK
jgi:hypothetical protein